MRQQIRFEPDESPPLLLAFRLALGHVAVGLLPCLGVVAIVVRGAGESDAYLSWAAFGALGVCAVSAMVQSRQVWRFGAGYLLLAGTSGAFIAASVTALRVGGPAMLGLLVLVSSVFQFALSARLSLLQRVITPTVLGTVRMLIVVSVMPIVFELLSTVPAGTGPRVAPTVAITTLGVTLAFFLVLREPGQLLAPGIGIVVGSLVGAWFGLYDTGLVAAAPWIGLPAGSWPGLELEFGAEFWGLLPAFFIVAIVNAMRTMSHATEIQRVSWRQSRATDHRSVQGAIAADGLASVLAGFLAVVPGSTYWHSAYAVRATGVASRRVGMCVGVVLLVVAISPKIAAVILAIPIPVIAVAASVMLAVYFVNGMKIVLRNEIDFRHMVLVGVALWIGVAFQSGAIFPGEYSPWLARLLENAMTVGGLTIIALTILTEWSGRRGRMRMETTLSSRALPGIRRFLDDFARRQGWGERTRDRMVLRTEETLLILLPEDDAEEEEHWTEERRLLLVARPGARGAELEFLTASNAANIEDRAALVSATEDPEPRYEFSRRVLGSPTTTVRHQKYYDTDIVTVRVDIDRKDAAESSRRAA